MAQLQSVFQALVVIEFMLLLSNLHYSDYRQHRLKLRQIEVLIAQGKSLQYLLCAVR